MKIYCDESGYTGADLLEANQPYFVYSGVKLDERDRNEAISLIYSNYKIQGKEIKARNLLQNEQGKKAILKLFDAYGANARIVYFDKKFSLAAKIFEYAVEPNLKSNYLAYQSGFNIFIATGLYLYFLYTDVDTEKLFRLFLAELRGQKNAESIFLFEHKNSESFILWWTFEIVKFNPEKFYSEIKNGDKIDGWILDLTSAAMMVILTDWSKHGDELTVICDDSNLFKANRFVAALNMMGRSKVRADFLGTPIGFSLKKDIQTANSIKEPGLQIADIFSSTVAYCMNNKGTPFSQTILDIVEKQCLCTPSSFCMMPNYEIMKNKEDVDFYIRFMKMIWQEQRKGLNK